jgi:hypothetical protein
MDREINTIGIFTFLLFQSGFIIMAGIPPARKIIRPGRGYNDYNIIL